MSGVRSVLEVSLSADEVDNEQLADLTQRLRDELVQLDVDDVQLARHGDTPEGAKAIDAAVLGGILVHLARRPETLLAVSAAIRGWLKRQRGGTVKLTIDGDTLELTGASSEQQDRLVQLWVECHGIPA